MADVLLPSYEGLVSRWRSLSTSSREAHVNGFVLNYAYNSGKIENDAITYHDTHEVFLLGVGEAACDSQAAAYRGPCPKGA